MSNNKVDSHIQMPKCVLKRFEDKAHRFCYYDVDKKIIGINGHAKSINTKFGYYSKQAEDYLRDNIETPFSGLLASIDTIDFDKDVFTVDSVFEEQVKTFMYALIARSPRILMEAEKHSLFWSYISETARHDFAAINGPELARQAKLLDGFYVTFTVNKTEKPFVLSMCGIYSFTYKNANHVILPISPTIAITLIEKGAGNFLIDNNIKHMYLLEYESMIDQFNKRAFNTQCQEGYGYVISHDKNVLEELVKEKAVD